MRYDTEKYQAKVKIKWQDANADNFADVLMKQFAENVCDSFIGAFTEEVDRHKEETADLRAVQRALLNVDTADDPKAKLDEVGAVVLSLLDDHHANMEYLAADYMKDLVRDLRKVSEYDEEAAVLADQLDAIRTQSNGSIWLTMGRICTAIDDHFGMVEDVSLIAVKI